LDFVLTLLTVPNRGSLDDRRVGAVRAALRDLGAETEAPNWLSPNLACDILFSNLSPDQAEAAAARTLEGEAVDFAAQALPGRRKKLLVADMDGTVVAGETLDELADFAGLKDKIAAITARAMNGEIDFNESLRERIALLKGLREDCLKRTCERLELAPGARELVRVMRRDGAYTALVSGGFTFFTKKIAERLRFHHQSGNTLDIERGVLTGKVVDPIVNRDGKLNTLIHLAAKKQIAMTDILAVGDGANDLPMILAAGLGVAYRAKPVVAAKARFRLNHADLRGPLYLQGYTDAQIDH